MTSRISKIRELINKPVLNSLLSQDHKKWNLMCGSLDAIQYAQSAVDSYNCLNKDNIRDIGQHLIIFGLFQALYVQQDSVSNLCESMDIALDIKTQYPELYEIRQLRNKGIGHPSREGKTNNIHSMLIDNDSIELFSYTETGEFSFTKHKISDCIEKQNQSLCGILQKVIKKMRSIEKEHKNKYKQNKLKDCFPADSQYCFEKILQGILHINRRNLAFSHCEGLIKAIDRFKEELTKRGLQDDDNDIVIVHLEIRDSKYPLEKLKEYFSSESKSSINSQDARAYFDSAREHTLDLIKHTENLDAEYMNTA